MSRAEENTAAYDQDSFDVRASLLAVTDAVRHYPGLIAATCALTMVLLTAYVLVWPPIYLVEATLMVEADVDPARDEFYGGWSVFRKDDSRTEIELLTSGNVLGEVVLRKQLSYDDVYHPFTAQLALFWRESWPGRGYRALKDWLAPPRPDAPTPEALEFGRTVLGLKAGTHLEPVKESGVGLLSVKGPSRRVSEIANAIVDVYIEQRAERHSSEAKQSLDILTEEVARAQAELEAIEAERLEYLAQRAVSTNLKKRDLEIAKLTDLEANMASSRTQIAAMQAALAEVEAQLDADRPTAVPTRLLEAMKLKRLELQTLTMQARNRYREDSPEIEDLKRNLAELDAMIAEGSGRVVPTSSEALNAVQTELVTRRNSLLSELEGARAGLGVMEGEAERLQEELRQLPEMETRLNSLARRARLAEQLYFNVVAKRTQAAVSAVTIRSIMPSMRVVEYATTPEQPWWPRLKLLYPAGLVLGLVLGVAVALLASLLSGRVRRGHLAGGRGGAELYGVLGVAPGATTLAIASPGPPER